KIVNNYEYYKNIAVNLEWVETASKFYDWVNEYYIIGIYVIVCNFPTNYIKNNFERAYVQTVLTYMNFLKSGQNFCKIPPSERLKYMTRDKELYEEYITYDELRMKFVKEDYLIQKIKSYTEYDDIPESNIPESEINSVIPYLTGAENIEIGGGDFIEYEIDHTFISIKDNSIMLIECGTWGS
ncbi:MAG: hypothetical protein K2J39_08895, partial [Ruminococcus sp.]|nr:hypothetical protein [Ruminococcus sp.]